MRGDCKFVESDRRRGVRSGVADRAEDRAVLDNIDSFLTVGPNLRTGSRFCQVDVFTGLGSGIASMIFTSRAGLGFRTGSDLTTSLTGLEGHISIETFAAGAVSAHEAGAVSAHAAGAASAHAASLAFTNDSL